MRLSEMQHKDIIDLNGNKIGNIIDVKIDENGNLLSLIVEQQKTIFRFSSKDIETEINISLEDGFYGANKTIVFKDLENKDKTITIKLPEGVQENERIRLIGQGKSGKNGGKNGDLFIKINIENEKNFSKKRVGCPLGEYIVLLQDIDSLDLQYFMQLCRIWQHCIV